LRVGFASGLFPLCAHLLDVENKVRPRILRFLWLAVNLSSANFAVA